jgi:hypothetical protein
MKLCGGSSAANRCKTRLTPSYRLGISAECLTTAIGLIEVSGGLSASNVVQQTIASCSAIDGFHVGRGIAIADNLVWRHGGFQFGNFRGG